MISYAQNFEDVMAARLFAPEYRGFYVDIGAADPVFLSVTKHFYDSGWNGINVEPLARAHQKLVEARPRDINLNLMVGRESGKGSFFEFPDHPENSTSDKAVMGLLRKQGHAVCSHKVETLSLRDLCERYVGARPIDFMKIDVEGCELSVIEGADWKKYRPILLIIEAVVVNGREENWAAWEPAIRKAGYIKVHFDGLNNFYLREESHELKERFRLPPNLFDGFEVLRPDQHAAQLADNQTYHAAIIEDLSAKLEATERQGAQQQAELEAALAATEGSRAALEQEYARHIGAGAELADGLKQQLDQAREENSWRRKERIADAALLREQVSRCSVITEDLAKQHGLLLAKSEEHAEELRRHLEREVELATRVVGAETSLRERETAANAEREHLAHRLATADAERERISALESLLSQARLEESEQVSRYSAVAEDLARQHGLLLSKSEEHVGELRRHLERELELATRVASAETSMREQETAANGEREHAARRLETAQAERERISQQFAAAEVMVGKLEARLTELERLLSQARAEAEEACAAESCSRHEQSRLSDQLSAAVAQHATDVAELEQLLDQARAEAEEASAAEFCSRQEQSGLSDQLAAAVSRHATDVAEARELQRWFEQTLVETTAAARSSEEALRTTCAELTELRQNVAAVRLEHEDVRRQAEDTAAHQAAEYAQAIRDYEIKLGEVSLALSERQGTEIAVRDAWLREGYGLFHTLRAEREPWSIRLARELSGSRERERQAELGDRVACWSVAATDILAERLSSTMDVNMTDENRVRRADSLDELLFLADRAFVRCAFLTLLGRHVDPDGEAYYLSRLRRGYAKIALLKQLRRSAEGRLNDPGIAGLDRAIARYRRANMPMVGWLVRQLNGEEGDGTAARRLRAIENRIGALQDRFPTLTELAPDAD